MPAPRPSESAEAARAAALQAEFNEKKWVWVPDDKEGYLGGWVINEDGDVGEIIMASGSEVCYFIHNICHGSLAYRLIAGSQDSAICTLEDEPTEIR